MNKFTAIFILPDYIRDNQFYATDWIVRVHAEGKTVDHAVIDAHNKLFAALAAGGRTREAAEEAAEESEMLAIFAGHQQDLLALEDAR